MGMIRIAVIELLATVKDDGKLRSVVCDAIAKKYNLNFAVLWETAFQVLEPNAPISPYGIKVDVELVKELRKSL